MMTVAERLVCERGGSCEIRQVVAMMEVVTSERGDAQRRRLPQGAKRWRARLGGLVGSFSRVEAAMACSVALHH